MKKANWFGSPFRHRLAYCQWFYQRRRIHQSQKKLQKTYARWPPERTMTQETPGWTSFHSTIIDRIFHIDKIHIVLFISTFGAGCRHFCRLPARFVSLSSRRRRNLPAELPIVGFRVKSSDTRDSPENCSVTALLAIPPSIISAEFQRLDVIGLVQSHCIVFDLVWFAFALVYTLVGSDPTFESACKSRLALTRCLKNIRF